jgi:hypothetical protein
MIQEQLEYHNSLTEISNYDLFVECDFLVCNLGLYDEKDWKFAKEIEWKYHIVIDYIEERLKQCCFFKKHISPFKESNEELWLLYLEWKYPHQDQKEGWEVETELLKRFKSCGFYGNRYVIIEKV